MRKKKAKKDRMVDSETTALICNRCKKEKDVSKFWKYTDNDGNQRYYSYCIECYKNNELGIGARKFHEKTIFIDVPFTKYERHKENYIKKNRLLAYPRYKEKVEQEYTIDDMKLIFGENDEFLILEVSDNMTRVNDGRVQYRCKRCLGFYEEWRMFHYKNGKISKYCEDCYKIKHRQYSNQWFLKHKKQVI